MTASVSDAVVEILETMHFLKPAMRIDVVNHSALARFIKPFVEEKIGGKTELETIVIAIRRNIHVLTRQAYPSVFSVLKDTKVELRTGFAFIKLKRDQEVHDEISDLVKNLGDEEGENSYLIQRADEISVVLPENLVNKIERLPAIKKNKRIILNKRGELAVLTMNMPDSSLDVPGIYALITTQLGDLGVTLLNTVGSFTRVSFLIKEEDAPLAYDKINKIIRESKKLSET